jgi:hypothetical protein
LSEVLTLDSEMMKIVAKRSQYGWLLGETNIRTFIEKLVDHPTNNSLQDLLPEALERLEEFKEVIRLKYAQKPATDKEATEKLLVLVVAKLKEYETEDDPCSQIGIRSSSTILEKTFITCFILSVLIFSLYSQQRSPSPLVIPCQQDPKMTLCHTRVCA